MAAVGPQHVPAGSGLGNDQLSIQFWSQIFMDWIFLQSCVGSVSEGKYLKSQPGYLLGFFCFVLHVSNVTWQLHHCVCMLAGWMRGWGQLGLTESLLEETFLGEWGGSSGQDKVLSNWNRTRIHSSTPLSDADCRCVPSCKLTWSWARGWPSDDLEIIPLPSSDFWLGMSLDESLEKSCNKQALVPLASSTAWRRGRTQHFLFFIGFLECFRCMVLVGTMIGDDWWL